MGWRMKSIAAILRQRNGYDRTVLPVSVYRQRAEAVDLTVGTGIRDGRQLRYGDVGLRRLPLLNAIEILRRRHE